MTKFDSIDKYLINSYKHSCTLDNLFKILRYYYGKLILCYWNIKGQWQIYAEIRNNVITYFYYTSTTINSTNNTTSTTSTNNTTSTTNTNNTNNSTLSNVVDNRVVGSTVVDNIQHNIQHNVHITLEFQQSKLIIAELKRTDIEISDMTTFIIESYLYKIYSEVVYKWQILEYKNILSHIKIPMTNMLSNIDKKLTDQIIPGAVNIIGNIMDFVDIIKIDTGTYKLIIELFNFHDLIKEVFNNFPSVNFECYIPDDIQLELYGDYTTIKKILIVLIGLYNSSLLYINIKVSENMSEYFIDITINNEINNIQKIKNNIGYLLCEKLCNLLNYDINCELDIVAYCNLSMKFMNYLNTPRTGVKIIINDSLPKIPDHTVISSVEEFLILYNYTGIVDTLVIFDLSILDRLLTENIKIENVVLISNISDSYDTWENYDCKITQYNTLDDYINRVY